MIDDECNEEEEGRTPKVRRRPKQPSKKEIEEHEATHIPFRSWCRHCLRGRGRNKPHRAQGPAQKEDADTVVPRIQFDYHFMSQEEERASKNPLLTMVDDVSGNVFVHAAGQKGVGQNREMAWLSVSALDELESWGYRGRRSDSSQ